MIKQVRKYEQNVITLGAFVRTGIFSYVNGANNVRIVWAQWNGMCAACLAGCWQSIIPRGWLRFTRRLWKPRCNNNRYYHGNQRNNDNEICSRSPHPVISAHRNECTVYEKRSLTLSDFNPIMNLSKNFGSSTQYTAEMSWISVEPFSSCIIHMNGQTCRCTLTL